MYLGSITRTRSEIFEVAHFVESRRLVRRIVRFLATKKACRPPAPGLPPTVAGPVQRRAERRECSKKRKNPPDKPAAFSKSSQLWKAQARNVGCIVDQTELPRLRFGFQFRFGAVAPAPLNPRGYTRTWPSNPCPSRTFQRRCWSRPRTVGLRDPDAKELANGNALTLP